MTRYFVFRGTPVTCAEDLHDLDAAALADLCLRHTQLPDGSLVNAKMWQDFLDYAPRLKELADAGGEAIYSGHSLGADYALLFGTQFGASEIHAFAPPQFADKSYWQKRWTADTEFFVFGRRKDFALGWDHLDAQTVQVPQMFHITAPEQMEVVTSWRFLFGSIADHAVEGYCADLQSFPGYEVSAEMCNLSSIVYTTDLGAMKSSFEAAGYKILDVIDTAGFRCAVLEKGETPKVVVDTSGDNAPIGEAPAPVTELTPALNTPSPGNLPPVTETPNPATILPEPPQLEPAPPPAAS